MFFSYYRYDVKKEIDTKSLQYPQCVCANDLKDVKSFLFHIAQDVQLMRDDMQTLFREISTLRHEVNSIPRTPSFPHRSSFKTGIMKASSTMITPSKDESVLRRNQTLNSLKSGQFYSNSLIGESCFQENTSHLENRCVKFSLPSIRNRHHHHRRETSPPPPFSTAGSLEMQRETQTESDQQLPDSDKPALSKANASQDSSGKSNWKC